MCLAIPAKILEIRNAHASVDILGVQKKINILPVENLRVGDHVLVHAGYAISVIDEQYYDFLQTALRAMAEDSP